MSERKRIRGRVTHQKRNVLSLPKEPQTPLQWSLPLQYFKSSPPSPVVSSSHTMAVSFSLRLSPVLPMEVIVVVPPTLAEHSSLTGHWFWTGMIQLADHGWWTNTASPLFEANTHRAKTTSPLALPSRCKAKRQIPSVCGLSKLYCSITQNPNKTLCYCSSMNHGRRIKGWHRFTSLPQMLTYY